MATVQPVSITRSFEPVEVERLQQANAASISRLRVEERRQQACSFLAAVGSRLTFSPASPRRTIATAQVLYHRFHLYFQLKDFAYPDVCVSSLLVAAKLEDTLKKLRDIQIAAYQVNAIKEGGNGLSEPSAQALDYDRPKLIGIERLILETISFNFSLRSSPIKPINPLDSEEPSSNINQSISGHDVFVYVVRLAKSMLASKELTRIAFRLAIDVHRTLCPLMYPAHTLALGCLYLASFLDSAHPNSRAPAILDSDLEAGSIANAAVSLVNFDVAWAARYHADINNVEGIAYAILDLFSSIPTSSSSNANRLYASKVISPSSPFEPSPASSGGTSSVTAANASHFVQIKIRVRDRELKRKAANPDGDANYSKRRRRQTLENGKDDVKTIDEGSHVLGRDDASIRFQFA